MALIHLIHTPAQVLGTPLGVGVAHPFAVFRPSVVALGVAYLFSGDLQQPAHIVRHGMGRGDAGVASQLFGLGGKSKKKQHTRKCQQLLHGGTLLTG